MKIKTLSLLTIAILLISVVYAGTNDLPFTITRIKYANGTLYSGVNITNITLYDDYSAGNILFSQERSIVYNNGTATFILYGVDDTTLNREVTYAQVKIESTTFTPRFNLSRTKLHNTTNELFRIANNGTLQRNITRQVCSGTDKFSAYDDGTFTCSSDQSGGGGGSISGIQSLNNSYVNVANGSLTNITINLTGFDNLYCSRNDWTTIDNYPSNCAAGQFVYGLGDSLSCRADLYNSTNDIWNIAINGTLARMTDLDNSTIIRKGNTTWAWNIANNNSFVERNVWTTHDNYPAACSGLNYVTAIGDTLTCSQPYYPSNCSALNSCVRVVYDNNQSFVRNNQLFNTSTEIKAAQNYWNSTDIKVNQTYLNNITFSNGCEIFPNLSTLVMQC